MRLTSRILALLVLAAAMFAAPAFAQDRALVVPSCGGSSFTPGGSSAYQYLQMDPTGVLCVSGGGGGGGGGVTLTPPLTGNQLSGVGGQNHPGVLAIITNPNTGVPVDPNSAVPPGTNNIGFVSPAAAATGGATPYVGFSNSGTPTANTIKGSAGTLYVIAPVNTTSTPYYLHVYNAASITCGTTAAVHVYPVPANSGNGGGIVYGVPVGENYSTGITWTVTANSALNDCTAAATGVTVNASFQ